MLLCESVTGSQMSRQRTAMGRIAATLRFKSFHRKGNRRRPFLPHVHRISKYSLDDIQRLLFVLLRAFQVPMPLQDVSHALVGVSKVRMAIAIGTKINLDGVLMGLFGIVQSSMYRKSITHSTMRISNGGVHRGKHFGFELQSLAK